MRARISLRAGSRFFFHAVWKGVTYLLSNDIITPYSAIGLAPSFIPSYVCICRSVIRNTICGYECQRMERTAFRQGLSFLLCVVNNHWHTWKHTWHLVSWKMAFIEEGFIGMIARTTYSYQNWMILKRHQRLHNDCSQEKTSRQVVQELIRLVPLENACNHEPEYKPKELRAFHSNVFARCYRNRNLKLPCQQVVLLLLLPSKCKWYALIAFAFPHHLTMTIVITLLKTTTKNVNDLQQLKKVLAWAIDRH